jgi:type VII secretion protein EccB
VAPAPPTDPGSAAERVAPTEAPATRDQVDAYRFGLRRLEAALVRGDPVPLHEQIRSQRRAVAAGAVLGALGVAGALVVALVVPKPDWRSEDLVVGRPSGVLYAVAHGPDRLVPVANAVAGRLVLAALRPVAAGSAAPVLVDDDVLADAPRTPAAAVPGAVAANPGRTVAPHWAVCDEATGSVPGSASPTLQGTTVLTGPQLDPAPPTDAADGVLLAVRGGATWLVTAGHRHRIDTADAAVRTALGLAARTPRPASPGLVSALPEGPRLTTPEVPRAGTRGPLGVPGRVGDVLVSRPAGGAVRYYAVLADGLQEVPPLAADVLAAASGTAVAEVGPEVVADVPPVRRLELAEWPAVAPRLREPAEVPAVCWTWSGNNPAGGVHLGRLPPSPGPPVALAQADGAGDALDAVAVGAGGAVRATAPGMAADAGVLWVVSSGGVAHGVPDEASAAALGITAAEPAPEAALRLLPTGPALDVAAAGRAVDVLAQS